MSTRTLAVVLLAIAALMSHALAQTGADPGFETSLDIGAVGSPGSSEILGDGLRVQGAGDDIWGERDAFHYRYSKVQGDFALTAEVATFDGPEEWGKAGLMLRSSTDADADNVAVLMTVGGRVMAQVRELVGGETTSVGREPMTPHNWLRILREGNRISVWYSRDGAQWRMLTEVEQLLPTEVTLGFAVSSHMEGQLAEAVFRSVSFTRDVAGVAAATVEAVGGRLHVTEQELQIWRERATSGPYRRPGDAGANSPGDWQRIMERADEFLEDPAWRHWEGNTTGSCYERGDRPPHDEPSSNIRDAAFVYLITEDASYRDPVRDELLALARESGTDFSNDRLWCQGRLRDGNPAIEIANWFTNMLVAYDYLGDESFAPEEVAELDAWFLAAARFFEREVHQDVESNFVDRLADDYRPSEAGRERNSSCDEISHYDGWVICSLAMYYNNRRALQARFFGLVGLKMEDPLLQERAKRFVKEWVMFSMYPDGVVGDFERWTDSLPDLGWDYGSAALASAITLADAFARAGDTELYEFTTVDGLFGTESNPGREKSILLAIRNLQSYLLPSVERYATRNARDVGNPDRLIDGKHEPANWYSAADVGIVPANLYYQDRQIHDIYTREHPEVRSYPENVAQRGPNVPWTGDWGMYPGVLFMFGGLEGVVDPYR